MSQARRHMLINSASPYSVEATAVLKTTFPAHWSTIAEYGFSHPALVPFINEDPMLIMSLIDGLGLRFATPAANQSYFITSMTYGTGDVEVEVQMKITDSSTFDCTFAGTFGDGRYYFLSIYHNNIITCAKSGTWDTNIWAYDTISENVPYKALSIIRANGTYSMKKDNNAESVKTGGNAATFPNERIMLFEYTNGSGTILGPKNMGMYAGKTRIKASGIEHEFAPFIRNNVVEFLDLTTLELCVRYGSFTISETLTV